MLFTSLFSITAMMLILGVFFLFVSNVSLLTQSAKDQFDMVEIFLEDSISSECLEELESVLSQRSYVESVTYVSKQEALQIMRKRWGNHGYLLDGLSENPLPASLQVRLSDLSKAGKLVRDVKGREGVEDVSCRQDDIKKITSITNHIQIGAVILILFLIIVSVVVVMNTIKLTVLARGRAISIMRYVGATNWFIRGPFLMEGIILGLTASIISILIIFCLYYAFLMYFSEKILIMFSAQLVSVSELISWLAGIYILIGMIVGIAGSLISMRKFLKM